LPPANEKMNKSRLEFLQAFISIGQTAEDLSRKNGLPDIKIMVRRVRGLQEQTRNVALQRTLRGFRRAIEKAPKEEFWRCYNVHNLALLRKEEEFLLHEVALDRTLADCLR